MVSQIAQSMDIVGSIRLRINTDLSSSRILQHSVSINGANGVDNPASHSDLRPITVLDAIGPYQVLDATPGVEVTFVSNKAGLVVASDGKFKIEASASFKDLPNPDILLVPGGPPALLPLKDEAFLNYIREAHKTTTYTTSVCTGALILGAAGLLKGVKATTHWDSYKELESYGAMATSQRYIKQGKIVTAAGVSSGIDMAIYLTSILKDEKIAKAVQLFIEYDPQPPFDAGSPAKAGPEIVKIVEKWLHPNA